MTQDEMENGSVVLSRPRSGSPRVRRYEREDFEAAYRLDQSCYPPGIAYSRYALREFLSAPGSRAWVAEEPPGELAGLVIVQNPLPSRPPLPAAATTTIPARTAAAAARQRGSVSYDS